MSTGGSKSICPLMTEGVLESNRVRAIAVEIVLGEPDMKVRRRLWGKLESFGPGVIGRLLPDWDILLCKAESGPYKQATGGQTCISDCLWQCHWSRLNGIWGDLRTSDSVLKKYLVLSTNNDEMPSIKNSTIVIFGGSSGIGYGVADKCLSEGAVVHISSSNPTRITQAVSSLKEKYPEGQVTGHTCDLSLPDVEQGLVKLFEEIASCDHIVYTAGDALAVRPLKDLDLQFIQKAGHIRFDVPLLVAKLALRVLKPGYTSSLILTGGAVGDRPQPDWAVVAGYAAGLYGMVRGLALDMKPLRVNFVSPGPVKTGLFTDELAEMFAKRTTLGKVGSVEEAAEAYVYLMKDTNATGSCVSTNAGSLLV
ncbi:oxidoreductase short chain dehydrogenase/reductase [Aspergillus fumigatus]|nr:oxidoreductase short chain dehydrogenase/reductase [Aspergillus fumigatus]